MDEIKGKTAFYAVTEDLGRVPLRDHLWHGYEDKWDFYRALRGLARKWAGRVGECVDARHGFLLLRFHDTPGGMPDEEWFPEYLLREADAPVPVDGGHADEAGEAIDRAFGFD